MPFSWNTLQKPIVALAPMSGVSDIAMRSVARFWGSDITFSEFISTDAIFYKVKTFAGKDPACLADEELLSHARDDEKWAADKSCKLAEFIPRERPFIIQLFGPDPGHFKVAAAVLNERFHPDGFDINFGCPARSVVNNGAGSCLFLKPETAKEIIAAVKEASGGLPTSIKLRASYKHVGVMDFISRIEGAPFENVTIHMRTYEQVHHGEPNWDIGKRLKEYFSPRGVSVIINGGIDSGAKAKAALDYTKADGVMVAQASLGNPFIFKEIKAALGASPPAEVSMGDRIKTAMDHARLALDYKGQRGIIEMRKHLLWYFKGFPNAGVLRKELSRVESLDQLEKILINMGSII